MALIIHPAVGALLQDCVSIEQEQALGTRTELLIRAPTCLIK